MHEPIIKRLKLLLGFNATEKKPVPIGIKRIVIVKIIPNTLPKNRYQHLSGQEKKIEY